MSDLFAKEWQPRIRVSTVSATGTLGVCCEKERRGRIEGSGQYMREGGGGNVGNYLFLG